jgi:hypothetical protein
MERFKSAPIIRTRQEAMPIWNSIKRLLRIENPCDSDEQACMTRIQRTYDEDHQQMAATLTLAELCLAKIMRALEMNDLQSGRVTCCKAQIQPLRRYDRSSEKERMFDSRFGRRYPDSKM